MKFITDLSFFILQSEDPRWETYKEWIIRKNNGQVLDYDLYIGIDLLGYARSSNDYLDFDREITLDFFFENIYTDDYYEIY
jgi:hypothetical protein